MHTEHRGGSHSVHIQMRFKVSKDKIPFTNTLKKWAVYSLMYFIIFRGMAESVMGKILHKNIIFLARLLERPIFVSCSGRMQICILIVFYVYFLFLHLRDKCYTVYIIANVILLLKGALEKNIRFCYTHSILNENDQQICHHWLHFPL